MAKEGSEREVDSATCMYIVVVGAGSWDGESAAAAEGGRVKSSVTWVDVMERTLDERILSRFNGPAQSSLQKDSP